MKQVCMAVMLMLMPAAGYADDTKASFTLRECYELALEHSETIGIQKEYIKETEALSLQALSTALPKVAFAYSQKWQDVEGGHALGVYTPEARFVFSQPLFTGFKEFAAIAANRHAGRQREAELLRARQLLFTDVADAFYLYLGYQNDQEVLNTIEKALGERVAELEKRQVIGKSRKAEVASTRSRLMRIKAVIESVNGQKEVAGQLMEYLIGRPFERLIEEALPDGEPDLPALYRKADQRADVIAARESFAVYRSNITAARSSFLPSVTLTANGYTKRSDAYDGNDWDATLAVNVPLFNGLDDAGDVLQARSQARQADLRLSQARRKALLEVRHASVRLEAARLKEEAVSKAVDAASENYALQLEDFNKSLVNNLDVLQALEDLQTVRREHVSVKAESARAYWALEVASGGIN